jgi:hypothetical protein
MEFNNQDFKEFPTTETEINVLQDYASTVLELANSFYERRNIWNRHDSNDKGDYFRAQYAYDLLSYLVNKNPSKHKMFYIKPQSEDERKKYEEFIVNLVFGIFDTAYFLHLHDPYASDFINFIKAEKICCREKQIEELAYFEWEKRQKIGSYGTEKDDWYRAEQTFKEDKIRKEAYFIYLKREEKRNFGNPEKDWEDAKEKIEHEDVICELAEMCWKRASVKYMPNSVYWEYGCKVYNQITILNLSIKNLAELNKIDQQIIENTITEVLKKYENN